ncbi:MAG: hypothetical protein LBL16_00485 [Endomicrobium sp.]|nr:hypothetical protein [Endomicrobium sp.]
MVKYILKKDTNWLSINNTQVKGIANGFNARIQQVQRVLFLCAEAVLLHDACEEYVSNPLTPDLNKKMDIYDYAIELAQRAAQDLLRNQRNNRNNVVEEVSDLLASDFLIVDAIARDAIALPANTVRNYDQQIADLFQVRADIEAAIQMLEQAIAFVENANAQQLSCMETLRHVSIILRDNETGATAGERVQRMYIYNVNAAIERVVFPKTEGRLSRFHEEIIGDLENAGRNADVSTLVIHLKRIRNNEGFIDFITTIDSLTRLIQR